MKGKNIKFPQKLIDETKEYIKMHKQVDPSYSFSKLVREALKFYIDFWYSEDALDLMFKYIDQKVETAEFEKFVARLFLRIHEYQIKNPDFKISDIPGLPQLNTEESMKKMEKMLQERLEIEKNQKVLPMKKKE